VLAFSRLLLGETDAWRDLGYDLDGLASNAAGMNHCTPVEGADEAAIKSDGNAGIDNSFGANLIPLFGALAPSLSAAATAALNQGELTTLVRLTDYDPGVDDSGIGGALYQGASLGAPPLWNGADLWPVTPDSVVGGDPDQPKLLVADSYVSGTTLVIPRINALDIVISIAGTPLRLVIHQAVVTAQISRLGAGASGQNGIIAGVLDPEELVAELERVAGALDLSLCNFASFHSLATQVRQASDIMRDSTNGDPYAICDAISIGLGFDASAALLGPVAPPEKPIDDPCAGG
jgi:hypothetical protein